MADTNERERPEWLERALAVEAEQSSVEVDGCDINVLAWGERGLPGIVLVHGGAAHARWWAPIAPLIDVPDLSPEARRRAALQLPPDAQGFVATVAPARHARALSFSRRPHEHTRSTARETDPAR